MSHADVYAVVSRFVPCTHMEWPDDTAPALPMACYYGDDVPITAGDIQIAVKHKWTVELYEKRRDKGLETSLANALREAFGSIGRSESYVENDNMLLVAYTFSQIEGGFDG